MHKKDNLQAKHTMDSVQVGSFTFNSRLILGTGKYDSFEQTQQALAQSGTELVTVAIRRVNIGQDADSPNLLDFIPKGITILPNTAGCYTVDEAVRTCLLARELLDGHNLVKLEILGDKKTLFPAIPETLEAAEVLQREGFEVMAYTTDDPITCMRLQDLGCVAVMPLAAPIGSGLGICNPYTLNIILEGAQVPVIVDAGIGNASDAVIAMEMGCDAVLLNSAVALAEDPILMAEAMELAVQSGRRAYLARRMQRRLYASASSPLQGLIR